MKPLARLSVAVFILTPSAFALAATQGSLSTTSSIGTMGVTANGPVVPRQVQVLNIQDMVFNQSQSSELNQFSGQGGSSAFCVVDTYGGAVSLTVQTANARDGVGYWTLRDGSNNAIPLDLTVTNFDRSVKYAESGTAAGGGTVTANVAAGVAVTASSSCGGGNLKVHIDLINAMPQTVPARTYTDTLTMTLTPQ